MHEKKVRTCGRILDAATAALIRRGPREPSVGEVMGAAGLTVGGFYGHFESKEALMLEAFGRTQGGLVGTQVGLRYTPRIWEREPFDFDLLVGTYFDQTSTRFVTLGVTVRY